MEMTCEWYPYLIKVFYANLKVSWWSGLLHREKGVNIWLDEDIWTSITGFRLGWERSHLGIHGLNKLAIYKACLIYPNEPYDYGLYHVGGDEERW